LNTAPLTAAELVAHPERIADVDPSAVPALLVQLATATAALAARLPVSANGHQQGCGDTPDGDRLLNAKEAAVILKMSQDFLRKSPVARPFRVYVGRELRFSARGIETFIARRAGRE
jgi:hypothetical protein